MNTEGLFVCAASALATGTVLAAVSAALGIHIIDPGAAAKPIAPTPALLAVQAQPLREASAPAMVVPMPPRKPAPPVKAVVAAAPKSPAPVHPVRPRAAFPVIR